MGTRKRRDRSTGVIQHARRQPGTPPKLQRLRAAPVIDKEGRPDKTSSAHADARGVTLIHNPHGRERIPYQISLRRRRKSA